MTTIQIDDKHLVLLSGKTECIYKTQIFSEQLKNLFYEFFGEIKDFEIKYNKEENLYEYFFKDFYINVQKKNDFIQKLSNLRYQPKDNRFTTLKLLNEHIDNIYTDIKDLIILGYQTIHEKKDKKTNILYDENGVSYKYYLYEYIYYEKRDIHNIVDLLKDNIHLFEIIQDNVLIKPYFELIIEKQMNKEEQNKKVYTFINFIIKEINNVFGILLDNNDFIILDSSNEIMLFYHLIIHEKVCFRNLSKYKDFMSYLQKRFENPLNEEEEKLFFSFLWCNDYDLKNKYILNMNTSIKNYQFRMINQSNIDKEETLKLITTHNVVDTFIQYDKKIMEKSMLETKYLHEYYTTELKKKNSEERKTVFQIMLDLKKKIKNDGLDNSTNIIEKTYDINREGYIYIVHLREHVKLNESIYKIGKTVCMSTRMQGYPKNSKVLYLKKIKDKDLGEKHLIHIFKKKFKLCEEYGREYFEGNLDLMMKTIDIYIQQSDENSIHFDELNDYGKNNEKIILDLTPSKIKYNKKIDNFVFKIIEDSDDNLQTDKSLKKEEWKDKDYIINYLKIKGLTYDEKCKLEKKQKENRTTPDENLMLEKYYYEQKMKIMSLLMPELKLFDEKVEPSEITKYFEKVEKKEEEEKASSIIKRIEEKNLSKMFFNVWMESQLRKHIKNDYYYCLTKEEIFKEQTQRVLCTEKMDYMWEKISIIKELESLMGIEHNDYQKVIEKNDILKTNEYIIKNKDYIYRIFKFKDQGKKNISEENNFKVLLLRINKIINDFNGNELKGFELKKGKPINYKLKPVIPEYDYEYILKNVEEERERQREEKETEKEMIEAVKRYNEEYHFDNANELEEVLKKKRIKIFLPKKYFNHTKNNEEEEL